MGPFTGMVRRFTLSKVVRGLQNLARPQGVQYFKRSNVEFQPRNVMFFYTIIKVNTTVKLDVYTNILHFKVAKK